ncbi:tRNA-(ms[2]io[6]A)-hydroxylase [bacterium SCSIO 12696]|nr:tRNA-(ms[2]io[6]A)-hydroxylase [bacterium SCSIO 12696]
MTLEILHLQEFLPCETPDAWIEAALQNPHILLIDHANCELKAAQSAQALIWKYGSSPAEGFAPKKGHYVASFELLNKMSKLAREELRHFEQVLAIMKDRNVPYTQISAARYAAELRKLVRTQEPDKLVDTLVIGAFIEARSCERFAKLAPHLDPELEKFYNSLLKSEARHFKDYLSLAEKVAQGSIDARVELVRQREQELIESPDAEFRFHSGPVEA